MYELVMKFRKAIIEAKDDNCFIDDNIFNDFPRGCCGDTCYLLAEYLQASGIETIYVCGEDKDQSHAWLVVNNEMIKEPTKQFYEYPNEIKNVLANYGCTEYEGPIDITCYKADDVAKGLIIDITADQFGEDEVIINYMGNFHSNFDFKFAHEQNGLGNNYRLKWLYNIIMRYIN